MFFYGKGDIMKKMIFVAALMALTSTANAGLMCPPKNPGCGIHFTSSKGKV